MDPQFIVAVRQGNPLAVARALSCVERGALDGSRRQEARELIRALFAFTGRAHIIGVTGAPGTGKSTLVNALALVFLRHGKRIAILAVDPSSPFSGGALLGDRLRMQDLAGTGIFIRSMASRGEPGGLAVAVADALIILDAAGFDTLFIETVGAGQGEVEIAKYAHTTVVVEAPGLGDEIQAIKAGILEIADVLVVNKADRPDADAAVAALEMNLNLNPNPGEWRPPVLKTIALTGEGVDQVADAIARHQAYLENAGQRAVKEAARFEEQLRTRLQHELLARALAALPAARWQNLIARITARECDVYAAVEEIVGEARESN